MGKIRCSFKAQDLFNLTFLMHKRVKVFDIFKYVILLFFISLILFKFFYVLEFNSSYIVFLSSFKIDEFNIHEVNYNF
jgi:hypothetical protein